MMWRVNVTSSEIVPPNKFDDREYGQGPVLKETGLFVVQGSIPGAAVSSWVRPAAAEAVVFLAVFARNPVGRSSEVNEID
jgi:hypothetical protein